MTGAFGASGAVGRQAVGYWWQTGLSEMWRGEALSKLGTGIGGLGTGGGYVLTEFGVVRRRSIRKESRALERVGFVEACSSQLRFPVVALLSANARGSVVVTARAGCKVHS